MKRKIMTAVIMILLTAGIILIAYPFIARSYYGKKLQQTAEEYGGYVHRMPEETVEEIKSKIEEYNLETGQPEQEDSLAAVSELLPEGILGTIKIERAGIYTPVFLSMDSYGLGQGACHVTGTCLPTVKYTTNCMFIGHSGLSHLKVFDDLDQSEPGDIAEVTVLDTTYVYRITGKSIIEPEMLKEQMNPEEGKRQLTLVTCTPVGINSHRLVVKAELEKIKIAEN